MEHYQNPANFRMLEDADGVGRADNPLCGDEVEVYVNMEDSVVDEIGWQAQACAVTMATGSMVSEYVKGKSVDEIITMQLEDVLEMLGTPLTASRQQCAQVMLTAVKRAVEGSM